MLRKIILSVLVVGVFANSGFTQGFTPGKGFKEFDFGIGTGFNYSGGLPLYLGFDLGLSDPFTLGPRVVYRTYTLSTTSFGGVNLKTTSNFINIGLRGNYHYSTHIQDLPPNLDLYGGLGLYLAVANVSVTEDLTNTTTNTSSSNAQLNIQLGARWYFTDKWGVNLEFTGGNLSGADIGLSYKL